MANFSDPANLANLIGLWDFRDGAKTDDTGLADGIAQNGHFEGDADASGGQLHTDGSGDFFDVSGNDAPFDLAQGSIKTQFTQTAQVGTSPDTIVNRGEYADRGTEGFFEIRVTDDGAVEVYHQTKDGTTATLSTADGIFAPGDTVNVLYSWDETSGATLTVENVTSGASEAVTTSQTGLNLDIGDNDDENFSFGARESDDGTYDKFFNGSIDYVAVYDTVIEPGPGSDGPVDGTSGDDVMLIGYVDAQGDIIDGADGIDDTIIGYEGDDSIEGGLGDDLIYGGEGDDTIDGDGNQGQITERESFEWDLAPDPNGPNPIENGDPITGFTQNTGNVDVTFSIVAPGDPAVDNQFEDSDQNVSGIDTGGETIDDNSSFESVANGKGNSETYALDFSDPVQNVEFRVNDIDGDGIVTIKAFDDGGTPIEVNLTLGSHLTGSDTDGVAGIDTADSNGGYLPDNSDEYSVFVSIPGPVSKIEIEHSQDGHNNSGVNITDVYFDVPVVQPGAPGDDTIYGGDGDDVIDGNEGDDLIYGDSINTPGGTPSGDNLIVNGSFEDTTGMTTTGYGYVATGAIPGWTTADPGNEIDVHNDGRGNVDPTDGENWLDLEASPGNIKVGQDVAGIVDGETYQLSFDAGDKDDEPSSGPGENLINVYWGGELIGTIDPAQGQMDNYQFTVVGGAGDGSNRLEFEGTGDLDNFGASVDSVEMFLLDGAGGNPGNDSLVGGAGDDTLFGEQGDDTLEGGEGDDLLVTGNGDGRFPVGPDTTANKNIADGGDGDDTIYASIGDDTLLGGDGDDMIDGNRGDDIIEGGQGNDSLLGEDGDDLIIAGAGDTVDGFANSDTIIVDPTLLDNMGENDSSISVDGGTAGLDDDGLLPDDDLDTLDLSAFESHRNLSETVDPDGDSTSGSVEVKNSEGEWVFVSFEEIEDLILPPKEPDGVVDGEEFGEVMNPLYDDANPPTDGGGDIIDGPDGLDDSIRGNGGDDTINAGEGNDTVDGGDDDDSIDGGTGADIIDGGDGNDTVNGQTGFDSVSGGAGDDLVTGGFGNDTVEGGAGNDELRGNDGDDVVDGGTGNDSMGGGVGDDTLTGGAGEDTLSGGSGDDVLDGGDDDDTIAGASGNDEITDLDGDNLVDAGIDGLPDRGVPVPGGTPDVVGQDPDPSNDLDTVTTGAGDDTISTGDDDDVIDAGDGNNVIDGGFDDDDITSGSGNDSITSGEGSDTVSSGDGDDTIFGGLGPVLGDAANLIDENVNPALNDPILDNGDDLIDASAGDDLVFGEDDNDTILGGEGDDTLDGGVDDDTILGGSGDDEIVGGQGADSIKGGEGSDTILVGTFTDPIFGDDYNEGYVDTTKGDTIIGGEDPDGNDEDVLDLRGSGPLKVIYDDTVDVDGDGNGDPGENGVVIFYTDKTATTEAGRLTFEEIENVIPCFTPGALIATPRGEVPVETLRAGDKVLTRDNGLQEIRWIGHRGLQAAELDRAPNLQPVLIRAGALGHGLPERDMVVSPQHRVLVAGEAPQVYFAESEVLVAAKHLVGKPGIESLGATATTYVHFMFDRHEVVLSDGAWTESFQPGDMTLGAMGAAQREEILALFPELRSRAGLTDYAAARRALKAHEARLLQL